jgi:DNA replication protein DnaC
MRQELTIGHLRYMNIGRKYWEAKRENLSPEQSEPLQSYFEKLDQAIRQGVGVFLWGINGVGKSYLASLLCKMAWGKCGRTSYCITAHDLRECWKGDLPATVDSEELMYDRIFKVPFLVVDDVGKEYRSTSGYAEHTLGSLLQYRVRHTKTTCITTNLTPSQFSEVYGKSTGHLAKESMLVVALSGKDMREVESDSLTALYGHRP